MCVCPRGMWGLFKKKQRGRLINKNICEMENDYVESSIIVLSAAKLILIRKLGKQGVFLIR